MDPETGRFISEDPIQEELIKYFNHLNRITKDSEEVSLGVGYFDPALGKLDTDDAIRQFNNLYAYCLNNPLIFTDPSGRVPVETIVDIASIGWSAYDLWTNPSWGNFGFLLWDVGATLVPYAPGSYVAKGAKAGGKLLSKADDLKKTGVWAMKAFDRGKEIEKALGGWGNNFPVIDKAVREAGDLASSITSIKSMDVTAKTYNKGNNMFNKLKGYVDDLAGFTDTQWGDLVVNVNEKTKRVIELALPAVELSKKQADQLAKAMDYAKDMGVEIAVKIVE